MRVSIFTSVAFKVNRQLEVMEQQQVAMDTLLSRAEIPIIDLSHMGKSIFVLLPIIVLLQ